MLAARLRALACRPHWPLLCSQVRRALSILAAPAAVLVVLALSACGSSSSSSGPLATALSYFPPGSPFVMSVATDPGSPAIKQAQAMVHRLPFGSVGEAALISRLQQLGINYYGDIQPLFGNPAMIGVAGSTIGSGTRAQVLLAWVTKDSGAVTRLIGKIHLTPEQTYRGAKLYSL